MTSVKAKVLWIFGQIEMAENSVIDLVSHP